MVTVLLPRGNYTASEATGSAAIAGGHKWLRFIVERHDGAQGERWAQDAAVTLEWSRNAGGPWALILSNVFLTKDDAAESGDPRGYAEGDTWHVHIQVSCPRLARFVRCRFRTAAGTIRTGVGVEEFD